MIHCGANKLHVCFVDASLDCTATAAGVTCDTRGYNYLLCGMACATQANTSILPIDFHLEEADVTAASSFATISSYKVGTDYTLATASRVAANCNGYMLGIPLTGRKRYMRLIAKSTTTTEVAAAWFHLFRGDESPSSSTECNCENAYFGA